MNNTDKLLRALVDALDCEMEEVESLELSHTIPFLGQTSRDMLHCPEFAGCIISRVQTDTDNHWELHRKVVDYKVTKKEDTAKKLLSELLSSVENSCNWPSAEQIERCREYLNEEN